MNYMEPEDFKAEIFLPAMMRDDRATDKPRYDASTLTHSQVAAIEEQYARDKMSAWAVFAGAYDKLYQEHIAGPLEQLAQIRSIDEHSDLFSMSMGARMQGFNLDQAWYTQIAETTLRSMLPVLPQYVDWNQGQQWYKFLSLLLDGEVLASPLYTNDYRNFQITPEGKLLHQGGDWFKTTHVQVSLSYVGYQGVLTSMGQPFSVDPALKVLDEYMPINLVLHHLGFYVVFEARIGVGAAWVTNRMRQHVSASTWDPKMANYRYLKTGKKI